MDSQSSEHSTRLSDDDDCIMIHVVPSFSRWTPSSLSIDSPHFCTIHASDWIQNFDSFSRKPQHQTTKWKEESDMQAKPSDYGLVKGEMSSVDGNRLHSSPQDPLLPSLHLFVTDCCFQSLSLSFGGESPLFTRETRRIRKNERQSDPVHGLMGRKRENEEGI